MGCVSSSLASRLREASHEGNLEEVRRLLVQEGAVAVINDVDEQGATALLFATGWTAVKKYYETFDALKKDKADSKAYNAAMHTVSLAFSQFPDNTQLVQLLLQCGAQANQQTQVWRATPLICASNIGNALVVRALLSAGVYSMAVDSEGDTALQEAASLGHTEIVSMLLDAGAHIDSRDTAGLTSLMFASFWGRAQVVSMLLAAGADIEARKNNGWTALICAAYKGHAEVVPMLLTAGADLEAKNNDGWTALMQAADKGHAAVVSLLLAAGADIRIKNNDGWTALIYAFYKGHAEVVSMLLDAGADIEVKKNDGWTALIYAASKGQAEVVSLLLAAGADIQIKTNDGDTALIQAVDKGHVEVVSLLLAAGTDTEARGPKGDTALIYAAGKGHAQIVRDLISAGAEVNTKNKNGWTPLIYAIIKGHPHIADDILTYGKNVDVEALTSHGHTARDWAESKGYGGLIRKIQAAAMNFIPGPLPVTQNHSKTTINPQSASSPTTSILTALPTSYLPSAPMSHPPAIPTAPPPPVAPAADRRQTSSAAFHSSWLIPYSDLQLGAELGRGSFAKVYNASWQGTDVAVKVFDLPGGPEGTREQFSASLLARISAEADLLASIRHPNVVAFLGMCKTPPCVVTENCSRGSLFDILRQAKTDAATAAELTWARRLSMAVDAATGMLHLHHRSPQVLHRDLKSPNLLVKVNWKAKVSDLGLSKLVDEVNAATTASSTAGQLNPRWMAPEVVEGGQTSLSSDVYAFGVVLWELLTWEIPWSHVANPVVIIAYIMRGDSLPIPADKVGPRPVYSSTYKEYIALIKQCTARLPAQRPQFATIVHKLKAMLTGEGGTPVLGVRQGSSDGGSAASSAVCVVCWEQPSTAGLVHTSAEMVHRCCCETCAKELRSRSDPCPMCRRPIDEVLLHFH